MFFACYRVGDVASTLETIPLLPILVDLAIQDPLLSVGSLEEFAQKKENVSLLDWLHLRNSNDSFERLSQMCLRGIQQVRFCFLFKTGYRDLKTIFSGICRKLYYKME